MGSAARLGVPVDSTSRWTGPTAPVPAPVGLLLDKLCLSADPDLGKAVRLRGALAAAGGHIV